MEWQREFLHPENSDFQIANLRLNWYAFFGRQTHVLLVVSPELQENR
jgi:hypothetical protein